MNSDKPKKIDYLLYLLNTTNLIFRLGDKLLKLFPDIEELFAANKNLTELGFDEIIQAKIKNPDWDLIKDDLIWAEKDGCRIITIYDACYPGFLKEIPGSPLLLFAIGDLELLKSHQIAMVGSRNPTPIGVEIATNFAFDLSKSGLTITSGFAIGIDGASHRGAIKAGGKTIAVMGTGLDHIYPRSHRTLAQDVITSGGLLLSEFPLNSQAEAWHFPMRNRIISGLSLGTLVVEASLRSGSLITARFAGEQGREVFAIPGSIHTPVARGCHHLIGQGAKLVEKPQDILDEFADIIGAVKSGKTRIKSSKAKNKLDCEYKKLLDCMGFEITTMGILAKRANLPVSRIGVILIDLELQGLIKSVIGGYVRIG